MSAKKAIKVAQTKSSTNLLLPDNSATKLSDRKVSKELNEDLELGLNTFYQPV